jgi:murein endopeptidase
MILSCRHDNRRRLNPESWCPPNNKIIKKAAKSSDFEQIFERLFLTLTT